MKLKLSKEVVNFIEDFTKIRLNGKFYYYIPYWFVRKDGEEYFEMLTFDKLPQELVRLISNTRDDNNITHE